MSEPRVVLGIVADGVLRCFDVDPSTGKADEWARIRGHFDAEQAATLTLDLAHVSTNSKPEPKRKPEPTRPYVPSKLAPDPFATRNGKRDMPRARAALLAYITAHPGVRGQDLWRGIGCPSEVARRRYAQVLTELRTSGQVRKEGDKGTARWWAA